jgi:hypothetical protein
MFAFFIEKLLRGKQPKKKSNLLVSMKIAIINEISINEISLHQ